jgi:hypothetical protein
MRSPLTDIVVTPMWRGLGNPRCLAARLPYRAERISFDSPLRLYCRIGSPTAYSVLERSYTQTSTKTQRIRNRNV